MKLYGIEGLGTDQRVFSRLTLNCELRPLDWLKHKHGESISEYAMRFLPLIDTKEPYGILGVSFGGLIAVELSKKLHPNLTILISSAETNKELRWIYRIIGITKIVELAPEQVLLPPRAMLNWLFGTKNTELLNEMIQKTDRTFVRWAIQELLTWDNEEKLTNRTLKIGGQRDKLIPATKKQKINVIEKGQHFMIVDKAVEISEVINRELKTNRQPCA